MQELMNRFAIFKLSKIQNFNGMFYDLIDIRMFWSRGSWI